MKGWAELHRHLDVSIRSSTLLELAQERGLEGESTSLAGFEKKLFLRRPLRDLNTVLATFTLFQKVLDRPEALERVAFEVAEDCYREGIRAAELRFSPGFVAEYSRLSWDTLLDALERGLERASQIYPDLKTGLLCIATREYGPESAHQTVDFYLQHSHRLLGLDLAGNEIDYPASLYESAFAKARGHSITIHAGEASGPDRVWESIERLGAQRIGHGIRSQEDPELMRFLHEKQICLEMCPTSNWITQCVGVQELKTHPLPHFLRSGIPVTVNTDDPGIFGVTLPSEIELCRSTLGLNPTEIEQLRMNAWAKTFLKIHK